MKFLWIIAFWVTIAFYAGQFFLSIKEGTFALWQLERRRVPINFHGKYRWQHLPMSFLNNWTVSISDLYVFPIVNALVVPYLWPMSDWQWKYPVFFIVGVVVSFIFHRGWWGHDENLGHIFANWKKAPSEIAFQMDLTKAGWVHFCFMSLQVAVVLAFIFTPMPQIIVFWVSGLLAVFLIIQNTQAVIIQRGEAIKFLLIAPVELSALCVLVMAKTII